MLGACCTQLHASVNRNQPPIPAAPASILSSARHRNYTQPTAMASAAASSAAPSWPPAAGRSRQTGALHWAQRCTAADSSGGPAWPPTSVRLQQGVGTRVARLQCGGLSGKHRVKMCPPPGCLTPSMQMNEKTADCTCNEAQTTREPQHQSNLHTTCLHPWGTEAGATAAPPPGWRQRPRTSMLLPTAPSPALAPLKHT